VAAFLAGRIGFLDIVETVQRVLGEHEGTSRAEVTLEDVTGAEVWARARAHEVLARR
jgi:1-deoxy-D-xylulose-5-phosphate reductoisomerase